MANKTYLVYNAAMVTTAAPAKAATGTVIKTHIQVNTPATAPIISVVAWGISFDANGVATPGVCELIETDVAATVTAYVAADIQKYSDPNAPASAIQIGSTTKSGFGPASAEGTITATRMADLQQISPMNQYSKEWALDREFECLPAKFLRVRLTFATTVNVLCWVIFKQEG